MQNMKIAKQEIVSCPLKDPQTLSIHKNRTMLKPMADARSLLRLRPEGLWCPEEDFYIDPVRPVARALITHGHSDHARSGHGAVLARARRSTLWRSATVKILQAPLRRPRWASRSASTGS